MKHILSDTGAEYRNPTRKNHRPERKKIYLIQYTFTTEHRTQHNIQWLESIFSAFDYSFFASTFCR